MTIQEIVAEWDKTKHTPFAAGRECDPLVKSVCYMRPFDRSDVNVLAAVLVFPQLLKHPLLRMRMRRPGRQEIRDVYLDIHGKDCEGSFPVEFLMQLGAQYTAPDDPTAMVVEHIDGDVAKLLRWFSTLEHCPGAMYEFTLS